MELAWYQKAILTTAGLALIWLAVYLYSVFQQLNEDYDRSDTMLAQCVLVLDDTAQKLKQETAAKVFAMARADRALNRVSEIAGESTDKSFKLLQANDALESLQLELAKLKESHAHLLAIALEPKPEHKPVRPKRKRPAKLQRASVYWWVPDQAAFSSASQRRR